MIITNSQCMSFTSSATGGEYSHKLTLEELPNAIWQSSTDQTGGIKISFNHGTEFGASTLAKNFDKPHNNIQPYIVVYFWKRTA